MRALGVVVFPPVFDDDLGFAKRVEDLAIQQFVPEAGVEAFAVSVFPKGNPETIYAYVTPTAAISSLTA
jgi:hypothetical protein